MNRRFFHQVYDLETLRRSNDAQTIFRMGGKTTRSVVQNRWNGASGGSDGLSPSVGSIVNLSVPFNMIDRLFEGRVVYRWVAGLSLRRTGQEEHEYVTFTQ